MTRRNYFILAVLTVALVLVPSVAMANLAIHGGYVSDTDACAGCHRAHTSVSSITWTDNHSPAQEQSALLVSSAANIKDFCYACHDATSQGAETNVEDGVYNGTKYGTDGEDLNGGGFSTYKGDAVTSYHMVEWDGTNGAWGAYGGGPFGVPATITPAAMSTDASGNLTGAIGGRFYTIGTGNQIPMDCATCHDPHGSANYRLLKDVVNGNTVGGYVGGIDNGNDPNPDPYVISAEAGYPTTGFRLHNPYSSYDPDYTKPQYAKGPGGDASKGMSGWCVGCHTTYMTQTSDYNSGDEFDMATRHRHPINVPLSNFAGVRSVLATSGLPLAHDVSEAGAIVNTNGDWIECLTCHYAHGTSAIMTGYASSGPTNPSYDPVLGTIENAYVGSTDSALLRLNNRGVCEVCHNK